MADRWEAIRQSVGRLLRAWVHASFGQPISRDVEALQRIDFAFREAEGRRALGQAIAAQARVVHRRSELDRAWAASRDDAERAGAVGRDDLARAAIERQLDIERDLAALGGTAGEIEAEIRDRERELAAFTTQPSSLPAHRQDPARIEIAKLRRDALVADRLARLERAKD